MITFWYDERNAQSHLLRAGFCRSYYRRGANSILDDLLYCDHFDVPASVTGVIFRGYGLRISPLLRWDYEHPEAEDALCRGKALLGYSCRVPHRRCVARRNNGHDARCPVVNTASRHENELTSLQIGENPFIPARLPERCSLSVPPGILTGVLTRPQCPDDRGERVPRPPLDAPGGSPSMPDSKPRHGPLGGTLGVAAG